ncbi:MAG: ABC transporter ATP-binding protein [Paracoccaceae bacterium]|nr:ABC transporter ATP-binding protein [Paracoccaceae bacterium]
MITLENVTKSYRTALGRKTVLQNASVDLQKGKTVGLIGRNGAGKTSLLRLLAGISRPDCGRVLSEGVVSWPVAYSGGLHGDMTGVQNIRFVARIYGRDTEHAVTYCRDMSELGDDLEIPVRSYSSGMRARLAFALSMAVPFDYYLIDEITSVGDSGFREKSEGILRSRLEITGGVIVSHAPNSLRRLCQSGMVLERGKLTYFPDVEAALRRHEQQMSDRVSTN